MDISIHMGGIAMSFNSLEVIEEKSDSTSTKFFESEDGKIRIENMDALEAYDGWESPIAIVSDGPYGVDSSHGDLPTHENLDGWYEPHVKIWSEKSTPQTTLWFWNTEIGWATVHPLLLRNGWDYVNCHVWNKGLAHIAGNSNTKTLRRLPVVTEICVQYVRRPLFKVGERKLDMKKWLRYEWKRTGLPFSKTNEAVGMRNAATRKYFTKDHLWYPPPPRAFEKLVDYANRFGNKQGKPYFTIDGKMSLTREDWKKTRAKFKCPIGITNVWNEPPLNGKERIRNGTKSLHLNQKPLKLIELIVKISSDQGDLVWDPFGGLATTAIAARKLGRSCYTAEINPRIFQEAVERFKNHFKAKQKNLEDFMILSHH
jgi:DNA modification methylase